MGCKTTAHFFLALLITSKMIPTWAQFWLYSMLYFTIDNAIVAGAGLEEPCESEEECRTPWSECLAGLCRCKEGFAASDGVCVPQTYACPVGQPLRDGVDAAPRPCSRQSFRAGQSLNPAGSLLPGLLPMQPLTDNDPNRRVDTCPEGYICFPYEPLVSNSSIILGHCCPAVKASCPIGLPLSDAVCVTGRGRQALRPGQRPCPSSTHYCTRAEPLLGTAVSEPVCCPKPCNGPGAVFKDGHCYSARRYRQTCQHNDQCAQIRGRCLDVGEVERVCECAEGQVYVPLLNVCADAGCPVTGATPGLDRSGRPVRCILLTGSLRDGVSFPQLLTTIIQQQQESLGIKDTPPVIDCGPNYTCDPVLQICCPNLLPRTG